MGFIESLLGSAKADLSNLIIYIAIVAAFIVGLIMCIAPVLETRSRLRRAIRSIKADYHRIKNGRRTTSSARAR